LKPAQIPTRLAQNAGREVVLGLAVFGGIHLGD
jgi:hypothetical protein